jgi:hypothetical protein
MRWAFLVAIGAIAATLWLPGEAAQPAPPAVARTAADDPMITFEQYRDWRNNYAARRRRELAAQLAAGDLPADRKARIEQVKAYYDRQAGLSDAERDRLYRERFDRIDTDHDGTIDRVERTAWRDKRRALYRGDGAAKPLPVLEAAP